MTRAETAQECRRLARAVRQSESEKLRRDYGKRLRQLQARLLYQAD